MNKSYIHGKYMNNFIRPNKSKKDFQSVSPCSQTALMQDKTLVLNGTKKTLHVGSFTQGSRVASFEHSHPITVWPLAFEMTGSLLTKITPRFFSSLSRCEVERCPTPRTECNTHGVQPARSAPSEGQSTISYTTTMRDPISVFDFNHIDPRLFRRTLSKC